MWLSGLLLEHPVQRVHSRVLGEEVLFAADGAEVEAKMAGMVYRESELGLMPGLSPEQVRAIHLAKCVFDGELVEPPGKKITVPTEELIQRAQTDVDACQNCGNVAWWCQASGERTCGVCHPSPQQNQERKEAAFACADARTQMSPTSSRSQGPSRTVGTPDSVAQYNANLKNTQTTGR